MLRETVLNRIIELIEEQYVFAEAVRELTARLRATRPRYAAAETNAQFAAMITRDMEEVAHDAHLTLEVRRPHSLRGDRPPVATTTILDHSIACITLNRFPSTNSAHGAEVIREIDKAFLLAFGASGIILDVRDNEGGDGSSVALATSYLLPPEPQLLVIYRYRSGTAPGESWTWKELPSETNGPYRALVNKPVCVLVSKSTFSAAEEFSYTLQQMKRAIVVGEQTRGGAHPSKRHVIDGTFELSLPFAETISPFTKRNWEGVGITPDKICTRRDALKVGREYLESLSAIAVQNSHIQKKSGEAV